MAILAEKWREKDILLTYCIILYRISCPKWFITLSAPLGHLWMGPSIALSVLLNGEICVLPYDTFFSVVKVCISTHSDYATIDLARTGTIKHDNPCALGPPYGLAYDWILEWMANAWVSYNGLLLCNPGCKSHCRHILLEVSIAIKIGCPIWGNCCPQAFFPRPGWSVARAGLGKPNRGNVC